MSMHLCLSSVSVSLTVMFVIDSEFIYGNKLWLPLLDRVLFKVQFVRTLFKLSTVLARQPACISSGRHDVFAASWEFGVTSDV